MYYDRWITSQHNYTKINLHVAYTKGNVSLEKNVKQVKVSIRIYIQVISFRKEQR